MDGLDRLPKPDEFADDRFLAASELHELISRQKDNFEAFKQATVKHETVDRRTVEEYGGIPRGTTVLGYACRFKNYKIAEFLIKEKKANVNIANDRDITPLHYACATSDHKLVKLLLESKANVNALDREGYTPLHYACRYARVVIAELLIKQPGMMVNVASVSNKYTGLHLACKHGEVNLVKLLVNTAKVSINVLDFNKRTPLHYAVIHNKLETLKFLCQQPSTQLNIQDELGETALYIATVKPPAYVTALIKKKVNVDLANEDRLTPLHRACQEKNWQVCQRLLENGANAVLVDRDGETPLHYVCDSDHPDHQFMFDLLIDKYQPSDLNYKNHLGNTCLLKALIKGHVKNAQVLINKGSSVHIRNNNDFSVLSAACSLGSDSIIETSIVRGVDTRFRSREHEPIHLYLNREEPPNLSILKLLMRAGFKSDPIIHKSKNRYGQMIPGWRKSPTLEKYVLFTDNIAYMMIASDTADKGELWRQVKQYLIGDAL